MPALTGSELLSSVPGLAGIDVEIEIREYRQVPGVQSMDILELAEAIDDAVSAVAQERWTCRVRTPTGKRRS